VFWLSLGLGADELVFPGENGSYANDFNVIWLAGFESRKILGRVDNETLCIIMERIWSGVDGVFHQAAEVAEKQQQQSPRTHVVIW